MFIHIGALDDPFLIRAHRLEVHSQLEIFTREELLRGVDEETAKRNAEVKYLVKLGYTQSLVDRWREINPKLLRKVLFHPDNAPKTGYRLIKVKPEEFRLDFESAYSVIYFLENSSLGMKYLLFMGLEQGIYIEEKLQIPSFACTKARADTGGLGMGGGGPSYPAVAFDYTQDLRLLITHLRFPDLGNRWYPLEAVTVDNRLVLPNKVEP